MTEAVALSAAWATQKIAEQSARWKEQIKPAKPINVPPEIKVSFLSAVKPHDTHHLSRSLIAQAVGYEECVIWATTN